MSFPRISFGGKNAGVLTAALLLKNLVLLNIALFILISPFSKKWAKISLPVGILCWVIAVALEHKRSFYKHLIPKTSLNKYLFLFLAAAAVSMLASTDFQLSQRILIERYIPYVLFFWLGYAVIADSGKNINFIVFSLACLGIFLGAGALRDYLVFPTGRISSVFWMKTNFGVYLSMLIPFNLLLLSSRIKRALKCLCLASLVLLLIFFILHASRGVWVTVAVSMVPALFFVRRKYLIIIIAAIILIISLIPKEQKSRLFSIKEAFAQSSVIIRTDLLSSAIGMFKGHPLFGAGLGAYGRLQYEGKRDIHAHNMYVEVMAEMGLAGLVSFLSILFLAAARLFKDLYIWSREGYAKRVFAISTGYAVFSCAIFNLTYSSILIGFQDAMIFWLMLAVALGSRFINSEPVINRGEK